MATFTDDIMMAETNMMMDTMIKAMFFRPLSSVSCGIFLCPFLQDMAGCGEAGRAAIDPLYYILKI
jgi:hypothetical protein